MSGDIMLSHVMSAATYGVNAFIVDIETNVGGGVFSWWMVGLPDNAVKESRERVLTAIKNSNLKYPGHQIVINLAPADVRK